MAQPEARPWQKGGPSPNPNGRPKTDEALRRMFREDTPEARERLLAFMRAQQDELNLIEPVRQELVLKAIIEILDRGIGKPKNASDTPPDPLEGKQEDEQINTLDEALRTRGYQVVPLRVVPDKDGA
jgi:hypothetical protein